MTDLLDRPATGPRGTVGVAGPGSGARRQAKTPTIALGVVVAVICGIAGVWLVTSAGETTTVLVFSRDVERGQVLEAADLTSTEVRADDTVALMVRARADEVVGRVALVDVSAGSLVSGDLVAEAGLVPEGQTIVGLDLSAGQAPSLQLVPGTTVMVLLTPAPNTDVASTEDANEAGDVLADAATVVEVTQAGQAVGQVFVSLAVDAGEARAVSSAASLNRVRLVQVGSAGE